MAKPKELTVAKTKIGRAKESRFPQVFSVVCALVIVIAYWTNAFQWLDWRHSDILFRQRGMEMCDPHISIVEIDDDSIKKIGQYPWPRSTYKRLIEALMKDGVKVVALDIMFIDPSRQEEDRALAAVTREFGARVVHAVTTDPKVVNENLFVYPFPPLRAVTRSLGQVTTPIKDNDGSIRQEPVLLGSATRWRFWNWAKDPDAMPTLGVKALAVYEGKDPREYLKKPYLIQGVLLRMNFRGERKRKVGTQVVNGEQEDVEVTDYGVPRIQAWRVIANDLEDAERARLRGGIVFVGSTSLGAFDHNPSPFSGQDPGVLVHATTADNLLNDRALHEVNPLWTMFLIPLFVALAYWMGRLKPVVAILSFAGGLVALVLGHYELFRHLWYIEVAAPLIAFVATFFALLAQKAIEENRKAAEVRGMFGQYVAPEVVDILVKNPDRLTLGGEKRDMTMFFLDIAHFTSISEKLTPEELIQFLNHYLTALTDDILHNNGVVDKYIGDCIMAFWNAPLDEPDHRKKACLSAVACVKTVQRLNKDYAANMPETPAVRIGLNSGEVVVGNTGSSRKLAYTVLGDEVNLASRLEGANKFFGSTLMASEDTYNGGKDVVEARLLGAVRVVGKNIPIKVYELLAKKGEIEGNWAQGLPIYHAGVAKYEKRDFEGALKDFEAFLKLVPGDKTAKLYLNACNDYVAIPPPPEWEPVFNLTSK